MLVQKKCITNHGAQTKQRDNSHAHTPTSNLGLSAEKSQYMPLWGSQMSLSLHACPICRAHVLQQPQPSSTELTPGAQ